MVLYRHVPNKAAVLDGVVEMVVEQLSLDTARPDWAVALRDLAHDFRDLACAHPKRGAAAGYPAPLRRHSGCGHRACFDHSKTSSRC
jgi:AcrR family transcriptional regulator